MSAGGPDWLDFDPPRSTDRRSTLRRRAVVGAVAVVTIGLVGSTVYGQFRPAATAEEPPPAASSSPPSSPVTSRSRTPDPTPRRFVDSQLALPGAGDWVLFTRDENSLFRVALDSGTVTRTDGLSVDSSNQVSLIAGPEQVLVVSDENGSGVLVPDGRPARPFPSRLQKLSRLYPGPPGLLWAQRMGESGPGSIALVDFAGRRRGAPLALGGGWPQPDGKGGLLVNDVGGVYELSRGSLRRITTGALTAVGANHLLLAECDARHRCSSFLLDRASRTRHRLGRADTRTLPSGVLSPDGRHTALIDWQGATGPRLRVQDLRSRSTRQFTGLPQEYGPEPQGTLGWTPDSRRLIMLLDGGISILDVDSGRIRRSGPGLDDLQQLTLRAPRSAR